MKPDSDLSLLYGPAAVDLPRVTQLIGSVAKEPELEFLQKMLSAALSGTGKLLRPAISILSARLGTYNIELVAPLAASVELLHTATLVHDDVIDEADQRRGQPTPNSLFGNAASVMLGDYMFANAADFIARTDRPIVVENLPTQLCLLPKEN
jgi:geranylgeranyl pyrophosphate synthase